VVGLRGIDFGFHWDEDNMAQRVRHAADTGVLLPGRYNYPSVSFWLSFAGLLPEAVASGRSAGRTPTSADLSAATDTPAYRLRVRTIFLLVTGAGVVATALLAATLGAGAVEAGLASAIVATSWEVGYHARWIAPDGVMMAGATLATACAIALAVPRESEPRGRDTHPRRRAGVCAALFTGLAIGTKYTAWPLLVVMTAAAWLAPRAEPGTRPRRVAGVLLLAGLAYLLTTPGTLLQPGPFLRDLALEMRHYATGHSRHTVDAGADHLWRMVVYIATVQLSPYRVASVLWSLLAAVGTVALWRANRRGAALLLAFPLMYLTWFATERVMIVRNLLVVAPVVAVLAARGAGVLWRGAALPLRGALATAVTAAVLVSAVFDVRAGGSIRDADQRPLVPALAAWERAHGDRSVRRVGRLAQAPDGSGTPAAATASRTLVAFYASDQGSADVPEIMANRPGTIVAAIGPADANFDYYPDWVGREHILVIAR
jgi:hypothetical protein